MNEQTLENQKNKLPKYPKGTSLLLLCPIIFLMIILCGFISFVTALNWQYPQVALYLKTGEQHSQLLLQSREFYYFFGLFSALILVCIAYQIFLAVAFIKQRRLVDMIIQVLEEEK